MRATPTSRREPRRSRRAQQEEERAPAAGASSGRRRSRPAAAEAREEAERRRERLAELVTEIEAAAADADLPSALRRQTLVQREWSDITGAPDAPDEALAGEYAAAASRLTARPTRQTKRIAAPGARRSRS